LVEFAKDEFVFVPPLCVNVEEDEDTNSSDK
jgi:hypothetical protein